MFPYLNILKYIAFVQLYNVKTFFSIAVCDPFWACFSSVSKLNGNVPSSLDKWLQGTQATNVQTVQLPHWCHRKHRSTAILFSFHCWTKDVLRPAVLSSRPTDHMILVTDNPSPIRLGVKAINSVSSPRAFLLKGPTTNLQNCHKRTASLKLIILQFQYVREGSQSSRSSWSRWVE